MTAGTTSLAHISEGPDDVQTSTGCSLPAPAFFRLPDVLRITALSRPTLYRRIAANRFPPPVHLGGRACGWSAAALQKWVADPTGYVEAPVLIAGSLGTRGRPKKYAK
jgi:predicted DNA-binding transcriptional regulator AlpA